MAHSIVDNFDGPLNFCVSFPNPKDLVKASNYCFADCLNKYYVKGCTKEAQCPILVKANIPSDQLTNYNLRCWIVYEKNEEEKGEEDEPVRQCFNHKSAQMEGVFRLEHSEAQYVLYGGHPSALINLSQLPNEGATFDSVVICQFVCLSTCESIGRRNLNLIVALEDLSTNLEVGRRTVKLKICKCPGRDMSNDVNRFLEPETKPKRQRKTNVAKPRADPEAFDDIPHDMGRRRKVSQSRADSSERTDEDNKERFYYIEMPLNVQVEGYSQENSERSSESPKE